MNIKIYNVTLTFLAIPALLVGSFALIAIWLFLLLIHPAVKLLEIILSVPKGHKIGRPALTPMELHKRMTGIY